MYAMTGTQTPESGATPLPMLRAVELTRLPVCLWRAAIFLQSKSSRTFQLSGANAALLYLTLRVKKKKSQGPGR